MTDYSTLLSHVDHTLLAPTATWPEIRQLCDEGVQYGCASVCIPPSFVKQAAEYLTGRLPVCTVIGFPNGYNTTQQKCWEASEAAENGAAELDMVVNLGWVKEHRWDLVMQEIRMVREICSDCVLKVIVETCLLTEQELWALCEIVSSSGADYIKTSTGFSTGGASRKDVAMIRTHSAPSLKIKAAGGIATIQDGLDFLALGADRLGTSRLVKAVMALEAEQK